MHFILANSADTDEMPPNMAYYLSLYFSIFQPSKGLRPIVRR